MPLADHMIVASGNNAVNLAEQHQISAEIYSLPGGHCTYIAQCLLRDKYVLVICNQNHR